MALKLESRKFNKVHESSEYFRIQQNLASHPHLALQPRGFHFQSQIQAPVCCVTTELLGVSGHEPNGRPGGLPML